MRENKLVNKYLYVIPITLAILNIILLYAFHVQKQQVQQIESKYLNSIDTYEELKILKSYSMIIDHLPQSSELDSMNLLYIIPANSCMSCIDLELIAFKKYKEENKKRVFGFYLTMQPNMIDEE